jgi:integrase
VYKRGRIYHYEFWYRGVRYRGSTGQVSKTAARRFEDDRLDEVRSGRAIRDITFTRLADIFLELHVPGKKSQEFFTYSVELLRDHFGEMMLSQIGVRQVEELAAKRRQKVSPTTVNRNLAVLKCMFNRAIDWRHAADNPVRRVKLHKERNRREYFLTEKEAERLLGGAEEKTRPVLVAALHTGARQGELLKLDWEDVDFRSKTIHFRDTKNGTDRAVPMDSTLERVLKPLRSRLAGEAVFTGMRGRLTRMEIRRGYERAARKAGLVGVRFHDLRHSYASFLVRSGVPLNTVRELLGHRTIDMTLRYSHLSPDHKREAVRVLDRLFSGESPQNSPQPVPGDAVAGADRTP